jgi:predicted AlkP superfamily phosphohydrolase/phosphomutase
MIWLNVAGRDPEGIVRPGLEYRSLASELKARLVALRDPETGSPAFGTVLLRDEVYSGPFVNSAPDVVLWPATDPPYEAVRSDLVADDGVFVPLAGLKTGLPVRRGNHRHRGMLMAWGKGVRNEADAVAGMRLIDVAPTMLYILGMPVPRTMDGRVLLELFEQPYRPVLSAEESSGDVGAGHHGACPIGSYDGGVESRLRGLGYIG